MDTDKLKTIRYELDITQEAMADLLQCDPVGYRRYESGGRPIPAYIGRCAELLQFLHQNKLLNKFKKINKRDLTL